MSSKKIWQIYVQNEGGLIDNAFDYVDDVPFPK